jgi:hypothetical protein
MTLEGLIVALREEAGRAWDENVVNRLVIRDGLTGKQWDNVNVLTENGVIVIEVY